MVANKGVFYCVQALGVLRDNGINARLVIAGDGPDEPAVRERVHALALEGQVNFVGAVHGHKKLDVIAKADVFLLPTFHLEGIPYALLETMAAGVVPVATHIGGIPDVVTDGIHGFLIPAHDALSLANAVESLATNSQKLTSMSYANRKRISAEFSVAKTVSRIRRIYEVLYPARHRRPLVTPVQINDA
jgi:glycosyltransferase involved in cell wall biosynthesis